MSDEHKNEPSDQVTTEELSISEDSSEELTSREQAASALHKSIFGKTAAELAAEHVEAQAEDDDNAEDNESSSEVEPAQEAEEDALPEPEKLTAEEDRAIEKGARYKIGQWRRYMRSGREAHGEAQRLMADVQKREESLQTREASIVEFEECAKKDPLGAAAARLGMSVDDLVADWVDRQTGRGGQRSGGSKDNPRVAQLEAEVKELRESLGKRDEDAKKAAEDEQQERAFRSDVNRILQLSSHEDTAVQWPYFSGLGEQERIARASYAVRWAAQNARSATHEDLVRALDQIAKEQYVSQQQSKWLKQAGGADESESVAGAAGTPKPKAKSPGSAKRRKSRIVTGTDAAESGAQRKMTDEERKAKAARHFAKAVGGMSLPE